MEVLVLKNNQTSYMLSFPFRVWLSFKTMVDPNIEKERKNYEYKKGQFKFLIAFEKWKSIIFTLWYGTLLISSDKNQNSDPFSLSFKPLWNHLTKIPNIQNFLKYYTRHFFLNLSKWGGGEGDRKRVEIEIQSLYM